MHPHVPCRGHSSQVLAGRAPLGRRASPGPCPSGGGTAPTRRCWASFELYEIGAQVTVVNAYKGVIYSAGSRRTQASAQDSAGCRRILQGSLQGPKDPSLR
eukprot:7158346-Pyramimonas_sp.AAC.1